jgi:hypothetical protein
MKGGDYAALIRRLAPGANERWVEAWMRNKHANLDHLTAARFRHEVAVAVMMIAEAGEEASQRLAESFGL